MADTLTSIYPIFDKMMSRKDKESLLHQRGIMIWMTGLSGSGKSTVAIGVERELHKRGILCRILDGDNIRTGINSNLGFSEEDRRENIRRIAEIGKLFVDTGIVTIACFVSPTNDLRQMAREIIGEEDFREVYIATPLEECERRDVKGLYYSHTLRGMRAPRCERPLCTCPPRRSEGLHRHQRPVRSPNASRPQPRHQPDDTQAGSGSRSRVGMCLKLSCCFCCFC